MTSSPNSVVSWLSLGETYLTEGNYTQALVAFDQALILAQQSCNPEAELLALRRLGSAHLGQGQPSQSVASIQQAIAIALEQYNLNALYECHRQLAETYKSIHSFELALKHFEAAEQVRDRLGQSAVPMTTLAATPAVAPPKDTLLLLFRSIVEQANVGIIVIQEDRLVYGNPRLQQWIGYSSQELQQLHLTDLVALPSGSAQTLSLVNPAPQSGQLISKGGQGIDVEIYATSIDYRNRPALVTFLRDVTHARQIEDQLKASEARYRSLIHHVPIGLCRFNVEGQPLDANPALLAIFGCTTTAEFLESSPIQPSSPVTDQGRPLTWRDYLQQQNPLKDCELKLLRPNGGDLWVRVVARAVHAALPSGIANSQGVIQYYEGAVEDITEIKAAQIALEELAMRDSLTHVYNRRHFLEMASHEIARSARFQRPVTLLMIDVDHFKRINDTHGHLVGDTVLLDIALKLKANLRQSDILARYGGEEFILLMPETDQVQAWLGAERLRKIIAAATFTSDSGPLSVTVSIGLSCWSANTDPNTMTVLPDINDLIGKADQALYRAKHSGRNQTQTQAWLHTTSSQIA
jgi:diguanylate cyclase (GGDEF)-like protein/PAS domain S-box-containing protein